MLLCKFCNKENKNENALRNHERLCKSNPDRQIANTEAARIEGSKKVECEFCKEKYAISVLKRHKRFCEHNPNNEIIYKNCLQLSAMQ